MLQSDISTVGELHGCAQYGPRPFGTKDAWYGEAMTGGQRWRASPGAEVAGRGSQPQAFPPDRAVCAHSKSREDPALRCTTHSRESRPAVQKSITVFTWAGRSCCLIFRLVSCSNIRFLKRVLPHSQTSSWLCKNETVVSRASRGVLPWPAA